MKRTNLFGLLVAAALSLTLSACSNKSAGDDIEFEDVEEEIIGGFAPAKIRYHELKFKSPAIAKYLPEEKTEKDEEGNDVKVIIPVTDAGFGTARDGATPLVERVYTFYDKKFIYEEAFGIKDGEKQKYESETSSYRYEKLDENTATLNIKTIRPGEVNLKMEASKPTSESLQFTLIFSSEQVGTIHFSGAPAEGYQFEIRRWAN
ncbi:MAG: hypothetical protein IKZ07_02715 [Akkermansia sp.]|nr:hypothetical protein [Akkermansia sp.]